MKQKKKKEKKQKSRNKETEITKKQKQRKRKKTQQKQKEGKLFQSNFILHQALTVNYVVQINLKKEASNTAFPNHCSGDQECFASSLEVLPQKFEIYNTSG